MVCNTGIRAMIRDDKLQQIQGALQAGAKDGMQTLNAHLAALVRAGRISYDAGLEACTDRPTSRRSWRLDGPQHVAGSDPHSRRTTRTRRPERSP